MNYFRNQYDCMRYPLDLNKKRGLRNAQIGAIHAIASYFTLKRDSGAIVVLPTGTGKTAVIQMAPYLICQKKVLIITPSAMVRNQIYTDYVKLKTLKDIGVFERKEVNPDVYELKKEVSNESNLTEEIKKSDVIIATEKCAESLSKLRWAKENIDLVEVDEGHHDAAETWKCIRKNLENSNYILFTATPFRLDQKEIQGEYIYTYSMSQAFKDGVFGKIELIPIDVQHDEDVELAQRAQKILDDDKKSGYNHCVMVRTDSKKDAQRLLNIYEKNTSLKLQIIDSSILASDVELCIKKLRRGDLDGIICVDMLGEGFDFPNLKIAVVHKPQKSLSSLLQFIGRFARTSATLKIGDAKFITRRDYSVQIENEPFFSSDEGWQQIFMNLYDKKIKMLSQKQDFFKELAEKKYTDIKLPFTPQSIKVHKHVKIFSVSGFNVSKKFPQELGISKFFYDKKNTIVGIVGKRKNPSWLKKDYKVNYEYELYIVHYMQRKKKTMSHEGYLFIHSSQPSEMLSQKIAESFCSKVNPVPQNEIHKILGKLKEFEVYSAGMLNRYGKNGESYRIMSGSNILNSIAKDTGRMFSAGHVFCKAKEVGRGDSITIGYSSGAKVWSAQRADIYEFILWCDNLGKKLEDTKNEVVTNTSLDYIPRAQSFDFYPLNLFFIDYSHETYSNSMRIISKDGQDLGDILDAELVIKSNQSLSKQQEFEINIAGNTYEMSVDKNGKYEFKSENLFILNNDNCVCLVDYFNQNPLLFYYTDGSFIVGNCIHKPVDLPKLRYDYKQIIKFNWSKYNTNLSLEDSQSVLVKIKGQVSVQDALEKELKSISKYQHIFWDHGHGEMADYITMEKNKNEIVVSLFHVKATKAKVCNKSVDDVYEVVGQAVKSTRWVKSISSLIEKAEERRGKDQNQEKHFITRKGDYLQFKKDIMDEKNHVLFNICIVQPSLSPSYLMSSNVSDILAAGEFFIKRMGNMSFLVYGR